MPPRWVWVGCALAAAAGGCAEAEAPPSFRTAPVERRDLTATVEGNGRVAAVGTTAVLPAVEGRLMAIDVRAGQEVELGQPLGRLDAEPLEHELAGARAAVAAASAEARQAEIALEEAERELERARRLAARGQMAQSRKLASKANRDRAQAGLRAARAQLQKARAAAARAKWAVGQTVLRAPLAGVVLSVPPRIGDFVSPRGPAPFSVSDRLTRVRIDASVTEAEVGRVRIGQSSTIEVPAFPGERFPARIEQVGVAARDDDGVPTYSVQLRAENPERRLLPGMSATVRFETASVRDALVVREAALRYVPPGVEPAPPRSRVFVVDGAGLRPVDVTAGVSEDGFVEVTPRGTLAEGERVVVGIDRSGAGGGPGISIGGR